MTRQQHSFAAHSASPAADRPRLAVRACVAMIRAYQRVLRPLTPPACRFAPSCSEFAHEAMLAHGVVRGGWLAVRRIGRCHPWHPGGFDPVPRSEA